MYSLYESMRILKNVYKQLVETSLSETGKPLAYVEDNVIDDITDKMQQEEKKDA